MQLSYTISFTVAALVIGLVLALIVSLQYSQTNLINKRFRYFLLAGEAIPFEARIVTVADTFDAMTSDRSYRKALSDEVAIQELKKCSGVQFDPTMVEAFLKLCSRYPDSIRLHVDDLAQDIKENNAKSL